MGAFLEQFEWSDTDPELGLKGYVNTAGEWAIVKDTATTSRCAFGTANYLTYWNNRANLNLMHLFDAVNSPLK